jgi:hypothetical protein
MMAIIAMMGFVIPSALGEHDPRVYHSAEMAAAEAAAEAAEAEAAEAAAKVDAAPCMTEYWYSENFVDGKIPHCTSADGADFSNQDLKYAGFSYRNLSGVNFSGADLQYANFEYANLNGADLSNANLFRAKLFQADLTNANLENTNLKGASLPDKEPTVNAIHRPDAYIETRKSSFKLTETSNVVPDNLKIKTQHEFTVTSSDVPNYESTRSSTPELYGDTEYTPNYGEIPNYESIKQSSGNLPGKSIDVSSYPPNTPKLSELVKDRSDVKSAVEELKEKNAKISFSVNANSEYSEYKTFWKNYPNNSLD